MDTHHSSSCTRHYSFARHLGAWSVHAFSISGVVWACLALLSLTYGHYLEMWGWLLVSLVVDALDGTFARKAEVSKVIPWFDGVALDLIVDYLTWTFIPAIFMYRKIDFGSQAVAMVMLIVVCASSMFCYCNKAMKSHDNYFVGFPAAWNIVILYIYLLRMAPWGAVITVIALALLTVLPLTFVHPFRVHRLQIPNIIATIVWLVCVIYLTIIFPAHQLFVEILWWVSGIWFIGVGVFRTFSEKTRHH